MKRKLFLIAICCQLLSLWAATAYAQEGFGLQGYFVFTNHHLSHPYNVSYDAVGVGFGVRVLPRWVVSLSADIAHPPTVEEGEGFFSLGTLGNIPVEYGGLLAYRFSDSNPTLYVYFGYSRFPALITDRSINLVHVGIGAAPFTKTFIELYPEISVAVPLQSHMILWPGGNTGSAYHVYVPVTLRFTVKLYITP